MSTTGDVIILGAGMAGASLAAEIAPSRRVLLVEMEDQSGRHSTGRSAAMFFESYGNPTVCALTRASRAFFEAPPQGFAEAALLSPRGAMFVADAARLASLEAMTSAPGAAATLQLIDGAAARSRCPILRADWVAGGVLDPSGHDMDVAAIHQGYLRLARHAGAAIITSASDSRIERRSGCWRVESRAGVFEAPVLVNATGAWADAVAAQAGVRPVGLQPMRRTAVTVPVPPEHDLRGWPLVVDVDELFYFKPEAGHLLLSPANEEPMDPCDVMPEELDVAIAVDRFETATTCEVKRIITRWAGLRSFVADRSPVAGFDAEVEGFFWLAGQGGYGIQMAPGLARAAAALLLGKPWPDDLAAEGVTPADIYPSRPALRAT
jgi:D-arginine dehydrogenase